MEKMRFEKNADMPINPLEIKICNGATEIYFGLTKREEFARSAMQGLLSCHGLAINKQANASIEDTVAHFSIRIADELLKQLDASH